MSADAQWVRPTDTELDMFGLTHVGRVRRENQDHFMLCTVHPQVVVHGTSLPDPESLPLRGERIATYMLVADGVGSGSGGGEASRLALATITQYVASSMRSITPPVPPPTASSTGADRRGARGAHRRPAASAAGPDAKMATTLTLAVAVFPWMYVTQVGDSRCYLYLNGTLTQITRDQTLAQGLADQGILPADRVSSSPLSHVLSSAIGGEEAMPVVSRVEIPRGCVILLATDGLTKHVSDAEITEQIRQMQSSEQLCRSLLAMVLERGASDNITLIAARAPIRAAAGAQA